MNIGNELLDFALEYRKRGLSVIPLDKKTALVPWKEFQSRLPSEEEICKWWENHPDANVGIVCGSVSGGLAVLDIDNVEEAKRLVDSSLCKNVTLVQTPRGGLHIYLCDPQTITKSEPLIPGFADLKAEGGYVVAPPSAGYKFLSELSPLQVRNPREEALKLLSRTPAPKTNPSSEVESSLSEPIEEGVRNITLTSVAGSLRWRGADSETIRIALEAINKSRCVPPLPEYEVAQIAKSIGSKPQNADLNPNSHNSLISHSVGSIKEEKALKEDAYYGLAGDIVRAIEPHSEADPAALLLQLLVCFGNIIGRSAHWIVEGDYHALNMFLLLIGRTAKGRKGTSLNHILKLLKAACEKLGDLWTTTCVKEGLSSGEGLIWHVRDASVEDGVTLSGVQDKRLMITESEFASVLKNIQRSGNTLSPTIRRAWDGKTLECLTKNNPAKATDAHISIIGHITREEIKRELTCTEVANGFGNRFLFAYVKRSKHLPHGGALNPEILNPLIERLSKAITFSKNTSTLQRDVETLSHWETIYTELSEGSEGMVGALTSRAEAQVRRIESIYATLDCSATVRLPHLKAALAVWKFSENSVKAVFGNTLGNPDADRIYHELTQRANRWMTMTEVHNLFGRHRTSEQIEAALQLLQQKGKIDRHTEKTEGRPTEYVIAY